MMTDSASSFAITFQIFLLIFQTHICHEICHENPNSSLSCKRSWTQPPLLSISGCSPVISHLYAAVLIEISLLLLPLGSVLSTVNQYLVEVKPEPVSLLWKTSHSSHHILNTELIHRSFSKVYAGVANHEVGIMGRYLFGPWFRGWEASDKIKAHTRPWSSCCILTGGKTHYGQERAT